MVLANAAIVEANGGNDAHAIDVVSPAATNFAS
jgi:hypothetical protein